jgi:hypothetical protein
MTLREKIKYLKTKESDGSTLIIQLPDNQVDAILEAVRAELPKKKEHLAAIKNPADDHITGFNEALDLVHTLLT